MGNNRNSNNDDDLLATTNHVAATGPNSSGNTLAPSIMPIVQQPRRPLGRESFRQRNLGCVPQNLVFRQDQPNLNIDNCFVLKSQLRRLSAGSGKELQFGGRARYSKSPELIETTFSMSTIAEEDQQELSSKSGAAIDA